MPKNGDDPVVSQQGGEHSGEGRRQGAATRLVAVSNRLPVTLLRRESGEWGVRPGSGGLVTALAPALSNRGGLWVGWPGIALEEGAPENLDFARGQVGYQLHPVNLTRNEIDNFYYGFSNEIIWPLFHDLLTRCNFVPEYWYRYLDVNRKYAQTVAETSQETDYVWVHDYHLMHVAQSLKELGVQRKTGFFLHIPFPPADIFLKLPWREQVLQALLEYDLIGFQTMRDRRNFIQGLQHISRDVRVRGRGSVVTLALGNRSVRVGSFPISIDFNSFSGRAASQEVGERAWYLHEQLPDRQVILGVDRLDYTKGIPERLEAYRNALERYPDLRGKTTLVLILVPSRSEIPEYQALKAQVEGMVGEINGQFTQSGWVPIHYLYRSLERDQLLAYYRLAEIALVTPLKDGMNLVAKEYCACALEENGVLIMSEFAGAAAELQVGTLMVNPFDIEGMADAIYRAFTMPIEERRERMRRMRELIRRRNIFWWVDSFLTAAFARKLVDFPALPESEEYIPTISLEGGGSGGEGEGSPTNP